MQKNQDLKDKLRTIADFPKPGITFYDITTLLADAEGLRLCVERTAELYKDNKPDIIAGIDARGFILASALAYKLGCGMTMIRKQGKLPCDTFSQSYQLEYGEATLEVHTDAFSQKKKVLLVDDLLATGGTAKAAIKLIEKAGGHVMALSCIIELRALKGRDKLKGYTVDTLIDIIE
ncbi:MAG: adenine phosphoribosyltransferase [Pseudomonadales bacterium]|nr:adenine phosphoribosyltransferase [Pseudomonadales bacterium]